jgi:hypothetical protein
MRVLFDNGTPRGIAAALAAHIVEEARSRNIRHQQKLAGRKIAIVVLGKSRWKLIKSRLPQIAKAVTDAVPGSFAEVDIPVD